MKKNMLIGIWKFNKDSVPQEALIKIAEELAKDEKYKKLYIRQTSKNQYGIGFEYESYHKDKEEGKLAYDNYVEKNTDIFKRNFGNGFAGWDIATNAIMIK